MVRVPSRGRYDGDGDGNGDIVDFQVYAIVSISNPYLQAIDIHDECDVMNVV